MNFKVNVNMRKIDILNARTASIPVEVNGDPAIVTGVCVIEGEGTDKQGNPCDVGYIATDKGIYGFISSVILKNMEALAEYLTDCLDNGEVCKIQFISGITNAGVEFFSFKVVE